MPEQFLELLYVGKEKESQVLACAFALEANVVGLL